MAKRKNKKSGAHRTVRALNGKKGRWSSKGVLGWSCYWSTPSDLSVPRPEFEEIVKRTLGAEFVPPEPRKKRSLRLALAQLEEEGRVVVLRDNRELAAYALVQDVPNKDVIDVDYKKHNIVVFDKETKEIRETKFKGKHSRSEIRQLVDHYSRVHVTVDVGLLAVRFIKACGGVLLRRTGGNYLLRKPEDAERLDAFIESFEGAECYTLALADNARTRGDAATVVQADLERDLELAAEDCKRLIGSDKTRTGTFQAHLNDFKGLKAKCEAYRDLLSAEADVMASKLDDLTGELTEALTEQVGEYEQSRDYPYHARVEYLGRSKKYGRDGLVVGYWRDQVKVLFDESQRIMPIATRLLRVAGGGKPKRRRRCRAE